MLKQKAKYYLVMFDENFMIFRNPFYSLPHYDKKGIGIKKLEKIIKDKNPAYAIIYDNGTKTPLKYYNNGDVIDKFTLPDKYMKLWMLDKNNGKTIYKTPYENEEKTYWQIVNNKIKAKGIRQNIKIAVIYDHNNKMLGKFVKNGNTLSGKGKYHKIKA